MSSWIQYNKPSLIVGSVGLVLFLGIAGWGLSNYLNKSDIDKQIESSKNSISTMSRKAMPPTDEVLEKASALVEQYEQKVAAVSASYDVFRKNTILQPVSSQTFQNALKAESASWIENCKSKGITVANEARWMGFDSYQASAPLGQAATILDYQKGGIEYFLNILMENGAVKFTRVLRPALDEEKPRAVAADSGRRGSARRGGDDEKEQAAWRTMPFEVTFTGNRQSVASILNTLASSEKYLYTFASIRIRNEKQIAPVIKIAKPEAPKATAPGISMAIPGGAPAAAAAPVQPQEEPVKQILSPVLGNENVHVHMAVNLIFFPPSAQPASVDDGDEEEGDVETVEPDEEDVPASPADEEESNDAGAAGEEE